MLNTQSRCSSLLIWLAIGSISALFLWSYFSWPPPLALLSRLLDSELAAFVARHQLALLGLLGICGGLLAYLLNNWRDRTEQRHAVERGERRAGEVLAREAVDLAVACETAARHLAGPGANVASALATLRTTITPGDHLLLTAPAGHLARLGAGAAAAARMIRACMRRLNDTLEANTRDDAASHRLIAVRAMETTVAAREASRVFEALARRGRAAADRRRLPPPPETTEIEKLLGFGEEAGKPSRLLPAT